MVLQEYFGLMDSSLVSSVRRRVELVMRSFAGKQYNW